jgi:16S rRNA (uracil1498-N3)-methyltransferase
MHRFFIPPEWQSQGEVILRQETAYQLSHVLRLKPGARILILDNSGWEREVVLSQFSRDEVRGQIVNEALNPNEPKVQLYLYPAMLKGQKLEWVLQKGTELGVAAFIPIITERVVAGEAPLSRAKMDRWRRIIKEAAEQSQRGRLPELFPQLSLAEALQQVVANPSLSLLPWEGGGCSLTEALHRAPGGSQRINIFIGPEGGFSEPEVSLAKKHGVIPITLGGRILRAETAALAAVTALLFALGEMGGGE